MEHWFQFYSVIGGAAATLMGLLFVAVALDARTALGMHPDSRRLAEQAFQNYLVVLLIALLALVPSLNDPERGYVALMLTAMRGIGSVVRMYWSTLKPYESSSRIQSLRHHLLSITGFALLIYAALMMALKQDDALTSFATATVLLLVSATRLSWLLLLRIAADRAPQPDAD